MTAPRGAWALFAATLAAMVVAAAETARLSALEALFPLALLVFALVGAVVAARQPRNPIGWILLAVVLSSEVTFAIESHVKAEPAPAALLLWLDDWASNVWLALVSIWIPLLFPDGRLPSPRWRLVAWLGTAAFAVGGLGRALGDRPLDTAAAVDPLNPYALPGAAGDAAAEVAALAELAFAPAVLGSMIGIVLRFRRSRGVERQQLKWFAYVGGLMIACLAVSALTLVDRRVGDTVGAATWGVFLLLVSFGLPLAIGAAILRHRLYDIDVVIRRTLVYGALTLTLAAAYLAIVLLAGLTVGESDVAVAASTLAVAALFRPARARIQAVVDRRFYRRRYDAARTLEAFGTRLREELDLEALGSDLRGVVADTVQPEHVSLWVRTSR